MEIALSELLHRGRRQAMAWLGNAGRTRSGHWRIARLMTLCNSLLSREGEAQGRALAAQILDQYQCLDDADRFAFLAGVADDFGPNREAVDSAIPAYQRDPCSRTLARLGAVSQPRRQQLIERLNLAPGGTQALVNMRADMLRAGMRTNGLDLLDADFVHLFTSWFNAGFLNLQEISWSSPAAILRKLIRYEAVHQIVDWADLRRRLEPTDRRCFAYFHPAMPDEPLIFVQVALTMRIPNSIQSLLAEDRDPIPSQAATTATFYSISTCQDGLRGIPFGSFLIKRVVEQLSSELAHIRNFVTLSPSPGFAAWVRKLDASSHAGNPLESELIHALQGDDWEDALREKRRLRRCLRSLAARYYLEAKAEGGQALDPVARFHLSNGARLERIALLADLSAKGKHDSFGVMVNYCYSLPHIARNHAAYADN
jgi:malonyl-CoA decarboxylase